MIQSEKLVQFCGAQKVSPRMAPRPPQKIETSFPKSGRFETLRRFLEMFFLSSANPEQPQSPNDPLHSLNARKSDSQ